MTGSGTAAATFEISAYVPDGPASTRLDYFSLSSTDPIRSFINEIRKRWPLKNTLQDQDILLYKVRSTPMPCLAYSQTFLVRDIEHRT